METINLELRLTHGYVGGWDHLDNWEPLGTARLTPARVVRESNDYDEGRTYVRWATVPAGQSVRLTARALADTLSRHGCSHDYDCCGCASYRTTVEHRSGRRLVLKTRVSFNY